MRMRSKAAFACVVLAVVVGGAILVTARAGDQPKLKESFYAGELPPFAYEPYARVLTRHVDDEGLVNYKALKADRADLDTFIRSLDGLDRKVYESWETDQKLAFWVNVYNAVTLWLIIEQYPIEPHPALRLVWPANSIRQIPNQWDAEFFRVMGDPMSLNEVEHVVLRESDKEPDEKIFNDPRIHMALVCAAMSCPPLRAEPFRAARLDEQFADQTRRFLGEESRFRMDRDRDTVYLSSIFSWFGEDFAPAFTPQQGFEGHSGPEAACLNFVSGFLEPEQAEYLRRGDYRVRYLQYDWALNEQPED